ncbi:unnamed protein product [Spirodela intermedia]|uniref:Uncharacterized protein n=1 Tax=Spirodela intermedia TaxID=51605 RepID=A0A7I8JQC6_SPIIN|nr:unnamed protein product [Spirodela intermedia]CAA6672367.1 unnamed protein product [Spirodela intermedia]
MAPLDEAARLRLWGIPDVGDGKRKMDRPAGEEIWPELAELVDSFYGEEGDVALDESLTVRRRRSERERLDALVAAARWDQEGSRIVAEAESAWRSIGSDGDPAEGDAGSKRRMMRWLRESGFDAGLCRSRRDETEGLAPVAHEYIDVICEGGERYIVDCHLAAEFEIARPTPHYQRSSASCRKSSSATATPSGTWWPYCAPPRRSPCAIGDARPPVAARPVRAGEVVRPLPAQHTTGQRLPKGCNDAARRGAAGGEVAMPTLSASYCRPALARRTEGLERSRKLAPADEERIDRKKIKQMKRGEKRKVMTILRFRPGTRRRRNPRTPLRCGGSRGRSVLFIGG